MTKMLAVGTGLMLALVSARPVAAQLTNLSALIQAVEQTTPLPPESLPTIATFYSAQIPNYPPSPGNPLDLPAWNLGNGYWLLDDFNVDYSSITPFGTIPRASGMSATSSFSMMSPDFAGGDAASGSFWTVNTNGLWLQITNVTTNLAFLNLNNATNTVYAIWSTTNLSSGIWQVETEIWPTNSVVMPFTVPTHGRSNLFMLAEDWTGVTENGNTTPDWWFFWYFGQAAFPNGHLSLSDSTKDSNGNPLLSDYQSGTDPNQIQFEIAGYGELTNNPTPSLTIIIENGVPSYYAVLVDSTDFSSDSANANWIPYVTSNITVNLGSDGAHIVWVGLRGLPSNAAQAWQQTEIILDRTPPIITLASPESAVVSLPMVQVQGSANKDLLAVDFDLSNASGSFVNQVGYITSRDITSLVVSNCSFQCYDVPLATGTNSVTIHVMDLAGNQSSTNINLTLDYSGDTTPPTVTVGWPQDGAQISGSQFTIQAQVDDPMSQVTASADGYTAQGAVQRNGQVRGLTLPLSAGTNAVSVVATDAAGNSTTNTFNVYQSSVTLTVNPLSSAQMNQSTVTVTGTVNDPTETVMVNGVKAIVDSSGNWTANNVPVSAAGAANLNVQAYPNGIDPSSGPANSQQQSTQQQPPVVRSSSYVLSSDDTGDYPEYLFWSYGIGGMDIFYGGTTTELPPNYQVPWVYINYPGSGNYWFQYPRIALDTGGEGREGTINTYAVSATMIDFEDEGLPPEKFQIQGQTLVNTGMTNQNGGFLGMTILNLPAGTTPDITPVGSPDVALYPPPSSYGQQFEFNVTASQITLQMAVDNNRDGQITFDASDATSSSNPWHFWINDSQEHGDDESSEGTSNDQIPGSSTPNSSHSLVQGRSDLVNFFPVALNFGDTLQNFPLTNGYQYRLSQADSAVSFVYTSVSPSNAFDYLTNATVSTGYGTYGNGPSTANVIPVPSSGTDLSSDFLSTVQANGGTGLILVEGVRNTMQPLMLEMWVNGAKLAAIPLYMSLSGVEQMWRHVNFCYVTGVNQVAARSDAPNEPITNGKNLVFLHGYNVNQQQARGVESEMFKRFFWSGSKAHFYGVTWNGYITQNSLFTPDLHTNVVSALLTASNLCAFLNTLSGETVVAGHSLGNMVVLSAVSDYNASPATYFMIDAAVPMEAVQGNVTPAQSMVYSSWANYDAKLYASSWWQLFPTNDARSALTWSNRLGNLRNVDVYNFYSSGEEVLRIDPDDPPSTVLGSVTQEIVNAISFWGGAGLPFGTYAWVWNEKGKGTDTSDSFIGSTHGGWKFNSFYDTNSSADDGATYHLDPVSAGNLQTNQLKTNSFFDFTSSTDFSDSELLGTNGSAYALMYRDRILSDSIPALSLPVGANLVTSLDERAGEQRNFDMGTEFKSGWPLERTTGTEAFYWHHSDFDYVAYPFTHPLFDKIVTQGNLK